jgi:hypothetical protein
MFAGYPRILAAIDTNRYVLKVPAAAVQWARRTGGNFCRRDTNEQKNRPPNSPAAICLSVGHPNDGQRLSWKPLAGCPTC